MSTEHHRNAVESLAALDVRLESPERTKQGAFIQDYDAWYAGWEAAPDAFWEAAARELHWFEPWTQLHEIDIPHHRWFLGGKTNISYNCLERNIDRGLGDHVAFHAETEDGVATSFTYRQVLVEVSRIANMLRSLGVARGDRVILYMPLGPEGIFSMQACARIGAVHSVVYAGMGPEALRHRIEDCQAAVVVASDATYRRGKVVELEGIVDKAVAETDCVKHVVIHRRETSHDPASGKLDFDQLRAAAAPECAAEPMDSEDPAFILYTSGTTGTPKGVVHVHGGYAVGVHMLMRSYFDTRENDVWWSTSDIGWIVGHSYICYGPMMAGATQVIREGAPDWPDAGVVWKLVEKYAVTTMFTAPTAVRMFMRAGEEILEPYDRSSLRVLFCAGEPFNPEAWIWADRHLTPNGQTVDNYWQTEIASPMIGTFPGMTGRPGYAGKPMPGVRLKLVTAEGEAVTEAGAGGLLIMEEPVPYMMRTLHGDPDRYAELWSETLGGYVTGDVAVCDAEGYWAVLGRSDDVLNVAGHRIGTADVESALITHANVVESAVVGLPDDIKGERIKAFVVLKGAEPSEALSRELALHVRNSLGPIAQPSEVAFIAALPKTRSGKIMRRLLKARELGLEEGDTSTLEE
ncbi:MAG: acetyl-CoA synthetase [Hyphomicrobiaceae bacterium]|jgi:acetyl-CoA synthetase